MCVCDAFVFVAVTRLSCTVFSQRLHQNTCKLPLHLLLDCAPIPVGRLRRLSKTSYLSTQTDFTGQVTTTNPPSPTPSFPSPQDLCFPSLSHITAYTPVHFPFFLPLHQQNRQHPVAHPTPVPHPALPPHSPSYNLPPKYLFPRVATRLQVPLESAVWTKVRTTNVSHWSACVKRQSGQNWSRRSRLGLGCW
jgi:hypothetical protein